MKDYLQFLGCSDAFASGGRFQTCFYVSTINHNFLIDFGATSLIALKKYQIPEIDTILLTHFHGDHYGGLPYFLLHEKFVSKRQKPLKLVGPEGLKIRVTDLMEVLYPGTHPSGLNFEVQFIEYSEGQNLAVGPLLIKAYKVIHTKDACPHALRIAFNKKVIAYSGDTEWTDVLPELAENADLFICECNFYDSIVANHLSYKTIVAHQNEFTCKKLVLTHMGDEVLNQLNKLQYEPAEDGKIIEL